MVHAARMTSSPLTRWISRLVACALVLVPALALVSSACQPPREPQPSAASRPAPDDAVDPGEHRAAAVAAHAIGAPGPAIAVTTIDGDTIDLGKLYGTRPVYLKFWATWCIPCREQMPGFERIYEMIGDRMAVIAVDTGLDDDAAAVRAFRERHGLRMPIVVDDGRLAAALDLQVTPQHVLIDRDARIAYVGHRDGERLDRAIQQVLARPASTGPVAGQAVAIRAAFRPGELVQGLGATTIDGAAVPLGQSRGGRPRGLVLFTTWCESYLADSRPQTSQACRRVREAVDQLAARGDVEWLGIAGGLWTSAGDVAEYRAKTGTKIPLALDADGALFRAFGVHQTPTVVLLDPDGRVARVLGPDEPDLTGAVRALVGAQ
jgi:peroxiredoxin